MGEGAPSFEDLAVRQGLLTPAQIEECRKLREKFAADGVELSLEEVLLKKGLITKAQAMAVHAALGKGNKAVIEGYEILGKLGQGGMGAVYKAKQTSMDRVVAIKVLLPQYAKDKDGVDRFLREARAIAKLNHPNIVSGIDAGYSNGIYYYVMEFLDGETLAQSLLKRKKLPWKDAVGILKQVAQALDHAHHHGLVHRDVKPANILILHDGLVKLADLGMARFQVHASTDITHTGQILGTPLYMSPEQARGETVDIRADLYSLGIVFHEMLAGRPPFMGDNPLAVLAKHLHETVPFSFPDVPPDVLAVGSKLTERDRERRYRTPAELLGEIEALLQGKPLHHAKPVMRAKTQRAAAPSVPRRRKSPLPLVFGGIAAAAIVAVGLILALPRKDAPARPAVAVQPAPPPPPKKVEMPKPLNDADHAALKALEAARAYEKGNPDDLEEIAAQYAGAVPKTTGTAYADRARQGAEETRARLEIAIRERKAKVQAEVQAAANDHAAEQKVLERHANDYRNEEWKRWLAGQRSRIEAAVATEERARREEEERIRAAAAEALTRPRPAPAPKAEFPSLDEFLDKAEALAAKRQYEKIAAEAPKSEDPLLTRYLDAFRGAGEVPAAAREHAVKRTGKPVTLEIRGGAKVTGVVEAAQGNVILIGGGTYDVANATAASLAALYREARGASAKAEQIVHFALLDGDVGMAEEILKRNRFELLPRFARIVQVAQGEREAEALLKAVDKAKKDEQQARLQELIEKHPQSKAAQAARKRLESFAKELVLYAAESPREAFGDGFEFHDSPESPGGRMLWVPDAAGYTQPPEES